MELGLAGKTVMVTGGSGGIGRGIVLEFAREGANVVSVDLDSGDHLVEEARQQGLSGSVLSVRGDIATRAGVDQIVEAAHQRFGRIGVLINNAGGSATVGPVEKLDDETRRWNVAVNIDGMINCTLAAGEDMLAQGEGSIINISSNASVSGRSAMSTVHYGGTKGFVNSFSKGLAWEWGERGVRINTIAPGLIVPHSGDHVRGAGSWWNKPALKGLGKPEDYRDDGNADIFVRSGAVLPRVGRPEDIAYLALFLASRLSSYLTGQLISVSGGGYMP
jgi:NAD(P)-dependent dehydrogenase (short-subunit alcohol dehydrogenase family)